MRLPCVVLVFGLLSAPSTAAPLDDPLNNQAVVRLVKSGLSDDVTIALINNQPGRYDTGIDAILALKRDGVSESVIKAMVERSAKADGKDNPSIQAQPKPQPAKSLTDVKSICVETMGNTEGAATIRAKVINGLASAGPWRVVQDVRQADAVLQGAGSVDQQFSASDGSGGTFYMAVLAARLVNAEGEILWTCELRSKPPKRKWRGLLWGGGNGWSTSSSVAQQLVEKLLAERQTRIKTP